tara:strand:+ start:554 stop:1768 length:1215 start_codon:yes stop_codon:yes gene_type:complete
MEKKNLPKNLPDTPGVYFFKKKRKRIPLYIGKATNLRDRTRSYFSVDIERERGKRIKNMLDIADTIEVVKTDSVLEALLLETELIKKFKPPYNSNEKDDKSYNYIVVTSEDYPIVTLIRGKALAQIDTSQFRKTFGPFPHSGELREALKIIRKIFPWRDEKCFPDQGKPCFNRQIHLCPGVCTNEITKKEYRFIVRNLERFLSGNKKDVIHAYKKKMKEEAEKEDFEQAAQLRNTLFALTHIHDVALLKRRDTIHTSLRIEGYDVAHLSGKEVVGVMVVMDGVRLAKGEYRKFKIKSRNGVDDVNNLAEILRRRFSHQEWTYPDIIIVDGGIAQMRVTKKVVDEYKLNIPVIAVTKDERHKPKSMLGKKTIIRDYKDSILLLNAEAHRFAITYHKLLRKKKFLT